MVHYLNQITCQCRSTKVKLIQLGSAHEMYGIWTKPHRSHSKVEKTVEWSFISPLSRKCCSLQVLKASLKYEINDLRSHLGNIIELKTSNTKSHNVHEEGGLCISVGNNASETFFYITKDLDRGGEGCLQPMGYAADWLTLNRIFCNAPPYYISWGR